MANPLLYACLPICLLVSGCIGSGDRDELESFVKEVKARPPSEIEPIPMIKPYETFSYRAGSLRSPFTMPKPTIEVVEEDSTEDGIRPDLERRKEYLEAYPLDALTMVGTLEKNEQIWAVIIDKDGAIHRVKSGNYVGLNHGKIYKVTEEKVFVNEIVSNPTGGWQERQSEMVLKVEEQ